MFLYWVNKLREIILHNLSRITTNYYEKFFTVIILLFIINLTHSQFVSLIIAVQPVHFNLTFIFRHKKSIFFRCLCF